MNKEEKNELLKKIDFWSKHQELDKFNINDDTNKYFGDISILITVSLGIIGLINMIPFIIKLPICYIILIIIIIIELLVVVIYYIIKKKKNWLLKINQHNNHFRIREAMIRVWYDYLFEKKINKKILITKTEEINELFTKIMEKLKRNPKMGNNELYEKAKEIMKNY